MCSPDEPFPGFGFTDFQFPKQLKHEHRRTRGARHHVPGSFSASFSVTVNLMPAATNQFESMTRVLVQKVTPAITPGEHPLWHLHRRAVLASLTSCTNRSASSSVITAVVTHPPENVTHTCPPEPNP